MYVYYQVTLYNPAQSVANRSSARSVSCIVIEEQCLCKTSAFIQVSVRNRDIITPMWVESGE